MNQPQESHLFLESSLTPPQPREACLEALARVLASQTFSKSARLSSFLRYVCTTTIEGQAAMLCEQHIGVSVFDRPEHYNPADDTIVRSTARLLRQRLAQYYDDEGRLDELRIAIPRGTYVPVFVWAGPVPAPGAGNDDAQPALPLQESQLPPKELPTPPPVPRRRLMLGAGLLLGLTILTGVWFSASTRPQSPLASFWSTLLPGDRDALLVVADAGLVLYQLETRTKVSLEDYASKRVDQRLTAVDQDPAARFRARRYTSMSSVQLAAELGKRATAAPLRLHMRFARDLQLSDLKHANAILLGVAQANPWWELYRGQLDFHIDWDHSQPDKFMIRNDRPRAGEQPGHEFRIDDPHRRGFATIAYTRGLGGDGRALLLGGTTSAGTDAAIELLLDPARMAPLLKQALQPDGSVGGFEILLQCVLQANGNTNIEILGFHTHTL